MKGFKKKGAELHSRKLRIASENGPLKKEIPIRTMISRIYVSLRECKNIANYMTWILDVNLAILKDRVLLNLLKFRGTLLRVMTQATNFN